MKSLLGNRFFRFGLVILLAFSSIQPLAVAADVAPAEAAAPADPDAKAAADTAITTNQDAFRAYLHIQEQLHNTLLAIEKNRLEAEAAAATNTEMMDTRLSNMERAISIGGIAQLRTMENANRTILIAAGAFALIGFLVLFVAAFLQWAAIKRLSLATSRLSANASLPALGEGQILPGQALEQSTTRFLTVIERLESRIQQMEATAEARRQLPEHSQANGGSSNGGQKNLPGLVPEPSANEALPEKSNSISMLLGKGQTLLKLDQAEAALGCLEEALAIDPGNTDVLIKKGAALERLQRLAEAIDCYDRVIAQDNTQTMAYLYKGAVFNRMERYGEALECYEQALKTRQKGEAANVIFE